MIKVSEFSIDIYIKEPADKGKANKSILVLISKTYKIPTTSISISRGLKSKNKVILIEGHKRELFLKEIFGVDN